MAIARTPKDESLKAGVSCDEIGCIGRLKDGRLVSFALSAEAFAEDCARANVVISPHQAPGACNALLIDRKAWRANGAMALRWTNDHFEQSAARPSDYERPWARPPHPASDIGTAPARPAPNATPKAEDLAPDD